MISQPANRPLAFTLIELLIVVAIIAILAAIAVPNFLEAQVRAKVSRAKADMRSIVTALESYHVDHNKYPPDRNFWQLRVGDGDVALTRLTTPVAYLTSMPVNAFPNETDNLNEAPQYRYFGSFWKGIMLQGNQNNPLYPADTPFEWTLSSSGPNRISNLGEYLVFGFEDFHLRYPQYSTTFNAGPTAIYDPTNGTISGGDIVYVGPGGGFY